MDEIRDENPISYNIKRAAALIGVSQSNLRTLVRQGILPVVRLRGRILLPREALLEFFRSRTDFTGGRVRKIPGHIQEKMKNSKGQKNG